MCLHFEICHKLHMALSISYVVSCWQVVKSALLTLSRWLLWLQPVKQVGSRAFLRYKVLDTFLHLNSYPGPNGIPFHIGDARISLISHDCSGDLTLTPDIKEHELASNIKMDSYCQIFIVENITPKAVRLFGGLWNVDPQFFLDYIDAVPDEIDVTKEETSSRGDLIPTPWYRHQAVEGYLPVLKSSSTRYDHVSFRFVGLREYKREDFCKVPERIKPDMKKMNVERIAGVHVPITRKLGREGRQFDNIAMTRHCASIWFKQPEDPTDPQWTKGKPCSLSPKYSSMEIEEKRTEEKRSTQ